MTTKKIAARVSGAETTCETAAGADAGALMELEAIRIQPAAAGRNHRLFVIPSVARNLLLFFLLSPDSCLLTSFTPPAALLDDVKMLPER